MKANSAYILLASCLAIFGAAPTATYGQGASKEASAAFETARIKTALAKIGIGEGSSIVVADERDLVENTAAEVLQRFLAKASLSVGIVPESKATGGKRILLGRDANLRAIRELGDKGKLNIRDVPATEDGFHLKHIGRDVVIAGANPRGVLYGVFALEDLIREGRGAGLDIKKVPAFSSRSTFLPFFLTLDHPAADREVTEATVEYFARTGMNGCIDGGGGSWELTRFVASDIFPFQKAPDPELRRRLTTISSLCRKYGIDYHIMLWEPLIPRGNAEIGQYPPEALGTVKRPWGGDENNLDRTLCVSSPIVQRHYQNLVGKFVRAFPDVKGFLFYNLDGNSWLCTPELCSRCGPICTDSPPGTPHPWETQAAFTDLLARTAREARSDFQFIHWISHFHDKAAEKLVRTSKEYSALAYGVKNGDHDVMIPDAVQPDGSEFLMLQKVSAERNSPFYVIYASNSHEVIPNGFQYPFHLYDSIRKLHGWGVRHFIGTGAIPYFNQINALAEKEFVWNPDQDPKTFLTDLSTRQFGKSAGKLMYAAWEEIRDGMSVWNDLKQQPFSGSQTHVSVGFSGGTNAKAILPDITEYYNYTLTILTNVEPFRAADYQKYKTQQFLDKFQEMGTHLAKAASLSKQAIAVAATDEPIGISYYAGNSIPTKKEYAELNHGPIAIADIYCQLRCNMIGACRLLEGMQADEAAGNRPAAQAKKTQYHALIRKDIVDRQRFVAILNEFAQMKPCLTRTSLSEEGIAKQVAYMNTEIEKMEKYLEQNRP